MHFAQMDCMDVLSNVLADVSSLCIVLSGKRIDFEKKLLLFVLMGDRKKIVFDSNLMLEGI